MDPLIARLPALVEEGIPVPDLTVLSEAAIGYARTRSGGEVDFAPMPVHIDTAAGVTPPVESKWVSDGWRPGARAIENGYRRGFVATKSVLDTKHTA